jgi:DNA-binding XRE family transcriptional regulator
MSDKLPSPRMIRAARGLLNMDQLTLGEHVGVSRRTIIRLENDDTTPTNQRRIDVIDAIRLKFEELGVRFVYADRSTGEGAVMSRGK